MRTTITARIAGGLCAAALTLTSVPAFAQADFSGNWAARYQELPPPSPPPPPEWSEPPNPPEPPPKPKPEPEPEPPEWPSQLDPDEP